LTGKVYCYDLVPQKSKIWNGWRDAKLIELSEIGLSIAIIASELRLRCHPNAVERVVRNRLKYLGRTVPLPI